MYPRTCSRQLGVSSEQDFRTHPRQEIPEKPKMDSALPLVRLLSMLASNQIATVSGSFNFPLKHPYLPARYPLSSKRRRTGARAKRNMLMSRLCVNNKNSSQRSHIFSSQPVHVCMSPTCILTVGHLLFWSYYMYAEYAYCEVGKQVRSLRRKEAFRSIAFRTPTGSHDHGTKLSILPFSQWFITFKTR